MPRAIHNAGSTLCFNPSHHPSIPPEGLELRHGVATPVTPEQAIYLREQGLEVQDDPKPAKGAAAPGKE